MQAKECLIKVEVIDQSDLTKLRGIVTGPPDTPFEGQPHLLLSASLYRNNRLGLSITLVSKTISTA